MAAVLEHDNWLDKSIDFLISDIIEYDMKRAGLSIIKEDKILPQDVIKQLESMEKKAADKKIGVMQNADKRLKESLKVGFRNYRLLFGKTNNLQDTDILSVKKDAIFVKRYCEFTDFGENIHFVEKNHYEAYLRLNNCEYYWKPDGTLDVKGINNERLHKHDGFMLEVIWKTIKYLGQYDIDGCRKYLIRFMDDYKNKKLPIEYYRELNQASLYSYIMYDAPQSGEELDEAYKPLVIVHYNYLNVLVPLLNLIIS